MSKPSQAYHTVAAVAERYRVNRSKVLGFIADGLLHAIDISQSQNERPRWRIPEESLRQFENARGSTPASKAKPARAPKRAAVRSFIQ